ncbi:PP2C family protein-serine/threonine phosphatase [Streptomyces sp. Z26]|uniref:PP2C family protein-serine/threonine phosphatase n=1 Tax=Streptomyces sp. Z26 TaxID=2500177 RepID=UPI001F0C6E0A|nr:PP2C family protein-serine/threonine phosphatase [Streptomyces sp. Z26]
MLDIASPGRVHLEALIAEQHDMGVCDAIEKCERRCGPPPMSAPRTPKVAGISPTLPPPEQTAPVDQLAAVQDQLAGWISDLTSLHDLTERLARTTGVDDAMNELLAAGATLVGARRGLMALAPVDRHGPERTVGLGLGRADLGQIETVPRTATSYTRLLDGLAPVNAPRATRTSGTPAPGSAADGEAEDGPARGREGSPGGTGGNGAGGSGASGTRGRGDSGGGAPGARPGVAHPDIATDPALDPRHREVAGRLGFGASYAVPVTAHDGTHVGAALWLYDEPAEPNARQRHLLDLYVRCAGELLARHLEVARARADVAAVREELLPSRLPRVPGVRLAVRHRTGPLGGGDWYDALPLPEGALGLSVGGVTGRGAGAMAAMGRLRASLRAYAVMEGEDPVAVLSDLELLLRLTEPARSATALFAYAEPATRRVVVAGAGHCPPLITGPWRTEYAETTLSAPLGMLACWEAPSVELTLRQGETMLFYSDGLLHRTGESADRASARLRSAAVDAPFEAREDPDALVDHVLRTVLPDGRDRSDDPEDVVLLAARFA